MQMRPTEVQPNLPNSILPNADWADAYEIETDRVFPDMRSAADGIVGTMPRWSKWLLWLRNIALAPFGLKPGDPSNNDANVEHVDFFPVLSEDEAQIVLGLDDRHLDFRILLQRYPAQTGARYRLTTLVEQHNMFGRVYLFLIRPFHRWIVRSVLKNAL